MSKSTIPVKTQLMGILNVTTNSFSDGGEYFEFDDAISHLNQLIEDGADIIDIGAESTKPYSTAVSAQNQLEKLVPILEYINKNDIQTPISIDTRSSEVAQKCIELGANIINDVSGFDYDPKMVDVLAKNGDVKIIIQHSQGSPENMQNQPHYENLIDEIFVELKSKIDYAISRGIKKENIIIDMGIGFGKTKSHNIEIIKRWKEFKSLGCPILLGISRKSLLELDKSATNDEKDIYTLALNSILINEDIDIIRVHNVKIHKKLLNILEK
jgi:dihydropteroate synthase